MRLSNSKVKTWRRCPKQYEFKYVMGLRPRKKELPLERGSWLHLMLQNHYEGKGWKDVHNELTDGFNNLFDEEKDDLGDLPAETARIMRSYMRKWKKEDKKYKVVDSELDELLTLPSGDQFNFIIDLIVEEDQGLWLWDHKTLGSFMPADFMLLDTQLARYFWAAEKMGYKPLRGVMFNEIRTKPPTVPKLLQSGELSQAKNIDTDVYTYLDAIKKAGLSPDNYLETLSRLRLNTGRFFRRTRLPRDAALVRTQMREMMMSAREIKVAEELEHFPRTPDKSCQWSCGYKDICITQLMGGDISDQVKMHFDKRR